MALIKYISRWLIFIIILYIGVVSTIQAFKCDKLTETQRFKQFPNNFLLKFKSC
jgi:putative Mn2+ efflux pump MntP